MYVMNALEVSKIINFPESESGPLALGLSRHLERRKRPLLERAQIVQLHLYNGNIEFYSYVVT